MPRRKTIRLDPVAYADPGHPFSITIATSPRRDVFADLTFGQDCIACLSNLRTTSGNRIYAYCLMPDHAHLLLEALADSPIPLFVQRWKSLCYQARRERGHSEPFWQRSFYDHALRTDEDLRVAAEYILNNPVRKGLVDDYPDYPLCGSFEFQA